MPTGVILPPMQTGNQIARGGAPNSLRGCRLSRQARTTFAYLEYVPIRLEDDPACWYFAEVRRNSVCKEVIEPGRQSPLALCIAILDDAALRGSL
jgi:hypothetical protein